METNEKTSTATVVEHLRTALTTATLAHDEGLPAPFSCSATTYEVSFAFHSTDDLAAWAVWLEAPVEFHTAEAHPGKVFHNATNGGVSLSCVETLAPTVTEGLAFDCWDCNFHIRNGGDPDVDGFYAEVAEHEATHREVTS